MVSFLLIELWGGLTGVERESVWVRIFAPSESYIWRLREYDLSPQEACSAGVSEGLD